MLFSNIDSELRNYTSDGPEEDLKDMLDDIYGPVLSVSIKRMTTPAGECLLGTAEVVFTTKQAVMKSIRASKEQRLYWHGRRLHAEMA